MTARQLAMMRHATASRFNSHRNYYCATIGSPDRDPWMELVEMGLARRGEPDGTASDVVFHVTEAGYVFVYGLRHEQAPECPECGTNLLDLCEVCSGTEVCESCGKMVCIDCRAIHGECCPQRMFASTVADALDRGVDALALANALAVSRTTVERWATGTAIPPIQLRDPVRKAIETITQGPKETR